MYEIGRLNIRDPDRPPSLQRCKGGLRQAQCFQPIVERYCAPGSLPHGANESVELAHEGFLVALDEEVEIRLCAVSQG